MSSAVLRRNSSRQGLQNLLRVTAQRSIEDAEEIERERRRRVREAFRNQQSLSGSPEDGVISPEDGVISPEDGVISPEDGVISPEDGVISPEDGVISPEDNVISPEDGVISPEDGVISPEDGVISPEDGLYEGDHKPSSPVVLDEDEGFSDCTQKLEKGTQPRTEENGRAEESQEEDRRMNARSRQREKTSFTTSIQHHQTQDREQEEIKEIRPKRRSEKFVEISEKMTSQRPEEWNEEIRDIKGKQEETKPPMENKMKEEKMEVKMSSKVLLQHNGNGEAAVEEVTSLLVKTKRSPGTVDVGHALEINKAMDAGLETELKLEKIRRHHQEKESHKMEQFCQRQVEAKLELEELKKKREERRKFREEEERKREKEEQQKLTTKEEEKQQMREEIDRRRMEAAEKRIKNLNISTDADAPFNPLNTKSPTLKITERTETLNRSLKKSNSFKKIQRPVLLPRIDDKLEQYTQAIEISSKESQMTKAVVVDMACVSPVASKKNLFEAGEAWNQSNTKATPTKDTDCMKVGVANLINHWVKGSPEGGIRHSPSTPSDVKCGVLQKKNMWEIIGEGSATERSGLGEKGSSSGKRFKFVVTGHSKYEKISTDSDHHVAYANGN